jgi:hypothetical protein
MTREIRKPESNHLQDFGIHICFVIQSGIFFHSVSILARDISVKRGVRLVHAFAGGNEKIRESKLSTMIGVPLLSAKNGLKGGLTPHVASTAV